jgi:hypothetical protein
MFASYRAERPLGYEQFTCDSATAPTIPEGCTLALFIPEAQAVRWRDDGSNPTATIGYPLAVGAELAYTSGRLARLKFIGQTAGATMNAVYYGD